MFFDDELNLKDENIIYVFTEIGECHLPDINVVCIETNKEIIDDNFFLSKTLKRDNIVVVVKDQLVEELIVKDYNTIEIKEIYTERMCLEDHCKIYIHTIEGE